VKRRLYAALFALACGCRPRVTRDPRAQEPVPDVAVALRDAGVAVVDAPSQSFAAWATVASRHGGVTVETSQRVAWLANEGHDDVTLLPGDTVKVGAEGEATVALRPSGAITARGEGALEVPAYVGASMVLTHGVVEVVAAVETGDAVRLDTPAARVIVAAGRARVAVGDDGSTAVQALAGAVTVWPSPTAPPERATRISAAELARRSARGAGHPILLDIDLPELSAASVRAVASRSLGALASVAWDALGDGLAMTPAAGAGGMERWFLRRRQMFARPEAHLVAVERLARAGAGDVADLRVALARLRVAAGTLSETEREGLLARVSLALGRLTARAHRGRGLATRGGDVTALVQVSSAEDLADLAREHAPFPTEGTGDP
jgi:hypothetical protein